MHVSGYDENGYLPVVVGPSSVSLWGIFKVTGITSTWPGDDTFGFQPSVFQNIRSFRLRATRTAGSAGTACRYAIDADDEALAEQKLEATPSDAHTQSYTYGELVTAVWSEWIDLSDDPDLPPLTRIDFLADNAADTYTVEMEVR